MHRTTTVKFRFNSARQTHSNLNKTNEASTSKNKAHNCQQLCSPFVCVCVCVVFSGERNVFVCGWRRLMKISYTSKFFRRLLFLYKHFSIHSSFHIYDRFCVCVCRGKSLCNKSSAPFHSCWLCKSSDLYGQLGPDCDWGMGEEKKTGVETLAVIQMLW